MSGRATFARQSSAAFFTASERCLTERMCIDGKQEIIFAPGIVCAALSIELGFKAMIIKEGGKATGHKLSDLFQTLVPILQNQIIQSVGLDQADFTHELSKMSDAFVKWRYVYECPELNINFGFMSKLAEATQKTAKNAIAPG